MGKKQIDYDDYDDDDIVVSKKAKRKMARQAAEEHQHQQQMQQSAVEEQPQGDDTMSRVALLCQENRWREAVLFCRQSLEEAQSKGEDDLVFTLQMALPKLEYSLRRQMVAALVQGMKTLI